MNISFAPFFDRYKPARTVALLCMVASILSIIAGWYISWYPEGAVLRVALGALGVGIALVILRSPLIGFILVIITIPLDSQGIHTGLVTLSPSNFFLLTTAISYALRLVGERRSTLRLPVWLPIALMFYVSTALFALGSPSYGARLLPTLVGAVLVFFFAVALLTDQHSLKLVTVGYAFGAVIQAILGWLQLLLFRYAGIHFGIFDAWLWGQYVPRVMGTHLDPNYYGIYLLPLFSIAIATGLEGPRGRSRVAGYALAALLGSAIFISYSRVAWMGAVFVTAYLALASFGSRSTLIGRSVVFLSLFGLILVSFIGLVILPQISLAFIRELVDMNERSVFFRYYTYQEALSLLGQSPFIGLGDSRATSLFVHNTVLYLALRAGLYGLIPFTVLVGFAILRGVQATVNCSPMPWQVRVMVRGYAAGFCAVFLASLVLGIEGHKILWSSCGLATAIGLHFHRKASDGITMHEVGHA